MPRRSFVYFWRNPWGALAIVGVVFALVGWGTILVAVGVGLLVPAMVMLPANVRIERGRIRLARFPFYRRFWIDVSDITAVVACLDVAKWSGEYGFKGVQLELTDGTAIPVIESTAFRESTVESWERWLRTAVMRPEDEPDLERA